MNTVLALARRLMTAAPRKTRRSVLPRLELLEDRSLPASTWTPVGPAPITLAPNIAPGQGFTMDDGAVESLAISPVARGAQVPALLGTTNGGIWRTDNIFAPPAGIRWTPTSDQLPSLAIGSVAFSPADPRGQTVWAGSGNYSNGGNDGSLNEGVYLSTNGGRTWSVRGNLITDSIRRILPTINSRVILVATAMANGQGGLYRSVDRGATFRRMPGLLGRRAVTDLGADPQNPNIIYAAVAGLGIFRSTDLGVRWRLIDRGPNGAVAGVARSASLRLAAARGPGDSTILYAGVADAIANGARLSGVFRATLNAGIITAGWRRIGTAPPIHNGSQAFNNFSLAVNPSDPNLVYVGGDQPANLFRGNAALTRGNPWSSIVLAPVVSGTAPHPDSIFMTFDRRGRLIEGDDGGLYTLANPRARTANATSWQSLIGNLQVTELYSIAYDPINRLFFGGSQDNGNVMQQAAGGSGFVDISGGDGNSVAIDTTTFPNKSIYYVLSNNFHFINRLLVAPITGAVAGPGGQIEITSPQHFLAPGSLVRIEGVGGVPGANGEFAITVVDADHFILDGSRFAGQYNGGGSWSLPLGRVELRTPGSNVLFSGLSAADNALSGPEGVFIIIPFALDAVDPSRMLLGYNNLYESVGNAPGMAGNDIVTLPVNLTANDQFRLIRLMRVLSRGCPES